MFSSSLCVAARGLTSQIEEGIVLKIIQFGTGRFLRGFFDPIVEEPGTVLVVQSRQGSNGAAAINAQPNGYHVWTRGIADGVRIDEHEVVTSIDRAVVAKECWPELCGFAVNPEWELMVSNTTAAGLNLDERDSAIDPAAECPNSFPAKVAWMLYLRFRAGRPGVTLLPLELVDNNATRLLSLVLEQAKAWDVTSDEGYIKWLTEENRWIDNLVDRIVVSPSDSPPWDRPDRLAVVGEPFRMLALRDDGKGWGPIPQHPMITWTDDLSPFFLRKVRILNGLHTAMVAKFLPMGIETVRECVCDPYRRQWVLELLIEEILPALKAIGVEGEAFSGATIERFENPFMEHRLSDIANGHESKLPIRIQPTFDDYRSAFGVEPVKLGEVLKIKLPAKV